MANYTELPPPARLRDGVETFWLSKQVEAAFLQRVTPDNCADILYTRTNGRGSLSFVGVMTSFKDVLQPADGCTVGVRFRPSMWRDIAGVDAVMLVDQVIPLEDLWGRRARHLLIALEDAQTETDLVRVLAQAMPNFEKRSPVQNAIATLELSHGACSLSKLAAESGLSERQFRRRCLDLAGLTPKMLARVARFRRAAQLAPDTVGRHADLAVECGYADQSHLIAEFRELSGHTPRRTATK